jgi:hypothetical protein
MSTGASRQAQAVDADNLGSLACQPTAPTGWGWPLSWPTARCTQPDEPHALAVMAGSPELHGDASAAPSAGGGSGQASWQASWFTGAGGRRSDQAMELAEEVAMATVSGARACAARGGWNWRRRRRLARPERQACACRSPATTRARRLGRALAWPAMPRAEAMFQRYLAGQTPISDADWPASPACGRLLAER